jgi:hypothetical protein
VRAMVYTGATHNFLSDRIVARLGLRVDKGHSQIKMKAVNSEAKPGSLESSAKVLLGEWSGKVKEREKERRGQEAEEEGGE